MKKLKILLPGAISAFLAASPLAYASESSTIEALEKRIKQLEQSNSTHSSQLSSINKLQDKLSIHGFINAGVVSSNADNTLDSNVPGTNINDKAQWQRNQSFGLQVGYQLSDRTDVVGQLVGRGSDDNHDLTLDWAYLSHVLVENKGPLQQLKVRFGREPVNTYLVSDYYQVGYAYPWVTPPTESYSVVGGKTLNGMDVMADFSLMNNWVLQSQFYIGENDVTPKAGEGQVQDFDKIAGFNFNFVKDAWLFRVGYAQADVTLDFNALDPKDATANKAPYNQLVDGYQQFGAGLTALNATLNTLGLSYNHIPLDSHVMPASFGGIGLSYDDGTWFVMSEYTMLRTDGFFPGEDASYITAGYRHGDFTPFVGYANRSRGESDKLDDIIANINQLEAANNQKLAATTPNPADPVFVGLSTVKGAIDGIEPIRDYISAEIPQTTYSLGVRYDFTPGAAAKFEVQKITDLKGTQGDLKNIYVTKFAVSAAF